MRLGCVPLVGSTLGSQVPSLGTAPFPPAWGLGAVLPCPCSPETAFEGAGWGHLKMLVLSGATGIGALTFPLFSQVVSQLPVSPESGETLFLAEQPPLPPVLTNGTGTSPGTAVPTAKPTPTLIKVQD